MKTAIFLMCTFLVVAPAMAGEREEHDQLLRDISSELDAGKAELSHALAKLAQLGIAHPGNRAFLGVVLDDDGKEDKGARVKGVTPGGPAQQGGLVAGDVITALDGTSLARDDKTAPARKLIDAMGTVKPGASVKVEFLRDGKTQSATVVTGSFPHHAAAFWHGDADHGPMAFAHRMELATGFGELELAALNPDLGAYFGATSGVLVVQGPASESVPLKGGDVILKIGERVPASPSQTWRILSSYDAGEKIPVTVLRQRKEQALTLTRK